MEQNAPKQTLEQVTRGMRVGATFIVGTGRYKIIGRTPNGVTISPVGRVRTKKAPSK